MAILKILSWAIFFFTSNSHLSKFWLKNRHKDRKPEYKSVFVSSMSVNDVLNSTTKMSIAYTASISKG